MSEKGLKLRNLIGGFLALAAALPGAASANPLPNMAVGEIDAIVTFCSGIDPRLEDQAERVRSALGGQLQPGARSSAEFRQGYELVSAALAQVDRRQALAACGSTQGEHRHSSGDR